MDAFFGLSFFVHLPFLFLISNRRRQSVRDRKMSLSQLQLLNIVGLITHKLCTSSMLMSSVPNNYRASRAQKNRRKKGLQQAKQKNRLS